MRPGSIIRLIGFLGLSLAIFTVAAMHCEAAKAQSNGVELLTRASKSYEAGSYPEAAELIDSAFKAGLSGELAARAILLRAQINERNGALARALQDYSNALWMESLPQSQRKTATEGKARVMAAMGLDSSTSPSSSNLPPRVQASASGGGSGIAGGGEESSSGGVLSMFSGLFGSSSEAKPEAPQPAAPQKSWQASTATSAPPAKKPASSALPVKTAKAVKPEPAPRLQPVSTSPVAPSADGYLIVFGSASNEVSGRSTAQYIKAQLADILVNRQLEVMAKANGGFQVQAGPYKAKSAALALCSAIKQRGVPCQVTP